MCHEIRMENRRSFIPCGDDCFVGWKRYAVVNNLPADYNGRFWPRFDFIDGGQEQKVYFQIDDNKWVKKEFIAGYHIASFTDKYSFDTSGNNCITVYFLASFNANDVLFFDGRDVSVDRFSIICPDDYIKYFSTGLFTILYNDYRWLEKKIGGEKQND